MLEYKTITLNAVQDEDIKLMLPWFNNINFLRNYDYECAVPYTEKKLISYLDSLRESSEHMIFAIRESGTLIGIIGLHEILWNNGSANIFIGIGDSLNQGRRYGTTSLYLLLEFAFNELNLHRLQLQVIEYNETAIKLYKSLGFKYEGRFREYIHRNNKRYDMLLYAILRREFSSLNILKS